MSDVVSVEYELTPEDWVSAVGSYARELGANRRALRTIRLLFGLTVAAMVLLLLWGGSLTAAAIWAVFGASWVTVLPSISRRTQRRHLRRVAREGVARGTFGPHKVALTDEGILDSAEGYDWLIHWSAVERVEDSGGALLVYNGRHSFLAIPMSAFPDRGAFEAFSARFFRGLEQGGRLAALTGPDESAAD